MRGDALVQSQLLVAQSIFAMADHLNNSTGFQIDPVLFVDLPDAMSGQLACISDSTVNTWGAVVAGGGTYTVLAFYNGTSWTVIAA